MNKQANLVPFFVLPTLTGIGLGGLANAVQAKR